MKIVTVPIAKVKPYPGNPRRNDDAVPKVAASLREFGWRQPIVVDPKYVIVAGHTRFKAAQSLGMKTVPVHVATGLTPAQLRTYRLTDNRTAEEAEWDDPMLTRELLALRDLGVDLNATAFDDAEIEALLRGSAQEESPDVDLTPPKKPKSERGLVYELGRHRVMCGDSFIADDVERLMNGARAALVFTDPPYGMRLDADFSDMEGIGRGKKYDNVQGDHEDYDPAHVFRDFGYCKEIILWGADYYAERIPKRNNGSWFVWDKMGGGNGVNDYDKMFGSNFELAWSRTRHKRALVRVLWKGIFGLSKEDTKSRIHPTQKPTELGRWFLDKYAPVESVVVDLFAGSGMTPIAAEQTQRTCYAMEIDRGYCDVIRRRYAEFVNDPSLAP